VLDAAFTDWDNLFNPVNAKRDPSLQFDASGSGSYVRMMQLPGAGGAEVTVRHTQVLPLFNNVTIRATLAARANASAWAHVHTRQYGADGAPIHTFHRRINEVEQSDNGGRVHQLRVSASWVPEGMKTQRAAEERDNGVVLDYLWADGTHDLWGQPSFSPSLSALLMYV
jgi:hypothetical protein